jgi:hypothetical protein
MLAGPNNIKNKDSIVYLSNISPITNFVLNWIVSFQQSNAQN